MNEKEQRFDSILGLKHGGLIQRETYRAKNPWLRLRLMVLGWNVLLGNKSNGSLDGSTTSLKNKDIKQAP